jgi:hypothetical protein
VLIHFLIDPFDLLLGMILVEDPVLLAGMLVSGYWILDFKRQSSLSYRASSIQYLAAYGANANFKDFFIFGSPPAAGQTTLSESP